MYFSCCLSSWLSFLRTLQDRLIIQPHITQRNTTQHNKARPSGAIKEALFKCCSIFWCLRLLCSLQSVSDLLSGWWTRPSECPSGRWPRCWTGCSATAQLTWARCRKPSSNMTLQVEIVHFSYRFYLHKLLIAFKSCRKSAEHDLCKKECSNNSRWKWKYLYNWHLCMLVSCTKGGVNI